MNMSVSVLTGRARFEVLLMLRFAHRCIERQFGINIAEYVGWWAYQSPRLNKAGGLLGYFFEGGVKEYNGVGNEP